MANVLGAARLSRKKDESMSIEGQKERIVYYVNTPGESRRLVYIAVDEDISGAISPFERADLGPWLTDPDKIAQWDTLVVLKIDRISRSVVHFHDLVEWCDKNGKTLVSISEGVDFSTSHGRMLATVLATFAQFERERISERRREAAVTMRENGWWQGNPPPYGWKPVPTDDGNHQVLREDSDEKAIIERMANAVIAGTSRRAIGRELTAEGIPTPAGAKEWAERTITKILKSEDTHGLLDPEISAQLSENLDKTKVSWTRRGDAGMLLSVAYCPCSAPRYAKRWVDKPSGKLYEYYICAEKCGQRNIRMSVLDSIVEEMMIEDYGDLEMAIEKITPGHSRKAELAAIERKIHTIPMDAPDHDERYDALRAEWKRIKNLPNGKPDKTEPIKTGQTLAQWWPTASAQIRRELLLRYGVKMTVSMGDDGNPVVAFGEFLLHGVTQDGMLVLPKAVLEMAS
jgi:site-specific DNA recombinase